MLAIGCFGAWLVRAFLGVVFVGNWRGRFLWEIGRAVCWCGGGVGRFLDGGVDCWRVIGRAGQLAGVKFPARLSGRERVCLARGVARARRLGAFRSDLRAWRVRARGAFGVRFRAWIVSAR